MKHPGFKAVQAKIASEGYSSAAAGAILAKKTREASPAAKKKNPNLKKVKTSPGAMKRSLADGMKKKFGY